MTPAEWERVESLFDRSADLSGADREAFLDDACGTDTRIRELVERLIEADSKAATFLEGSSGRIIDDLLAGIRGGEPANAGPSLAGAGDTFIGKQIGIYRIEAEIGRGGIGQVYRAVDTRLNRTVAIKLLAPQFREDENARRRFLSEARLASSIDHENLCTIHEIGETGEGWLFIAMTLYRGQTLRRYLKHEPIPHHRALNIAEQVLNGLAEAHKNGIVHRDVKPGNIMLTERHVVKLLDFGLAKLTDTDLTRSGARVGTIGYMSPEQIRGEPVDARSDLWSLGVVIYEMLAGEHPFRTDDEVSTLYNILERQPAGPCPVEQARSGRLNAFVLKLLEKTPAGRYQNSDAALADLQSIIADAGTQGTAAVRPRRSFAMPVAAVAFTGAVALLLFLWLGWGSRVEQPPPPPTPSVLSMAVFPFVIKGDPALEYLNEGMVTLLSAKLEGVAGLRMVDPNAIMGYAVRHPAAVMDPVGGRDVAAFFGASHFVLGNIVRIDDRILIVASMYDASGAEDVRAEVFIDSEGSLLHGLDEVAHKLVAARLSEPQELAGIAAMTTHSFPALRAYLDGERNLREGQFHLAVDVLSRAVALDSTFALAWYRLARAAGWSGPAALNERATEMALKFSRQLPERYQQMIAGYHVYRLGDPAEAERRYRAVLGRYPEDSEALFLLGETLFHNNPYYGRSTDEAWDPLMQALSYEPASREIMLHLIDLSARHRRLEALDSLTANYIAAADGVDSDVQPAYTFLRRWVLGDPSQRDEAFRALEHAGPGAVRMALLRVAPQLKDLSLSFRMARFLAHPQNGPASRAAGLLHLALFEAAAGDWNTSDAYFDSLRALDEGTALIHHTLARTTPFAPRERDTLVMLRNSVEAWNAGGGTGGSVDVGERPAVRLFLLGLLTGKLGEHEARSQYMQALAREPHPIARSFAQTLGAVDALEQGNPEGVLRLLDESRVALPFHVRQHNPLFEQILSRYLRAEALSQSGRHEEALPWYEAVNDGYFHWGAIYRPEIRNRMEDM